MPAEKPHFYTGHERSPLEGQNEPPSSQEPKRLGRSRNVSEGEGKARKRDYWRRYYEEHKEHIKEKNREYRQKQGEILKKNNREKKRRYRQKLKEEANSLQQTDSNIQIFLREKRKQAVREASKRYYQQHGDAIRERYRRHYQEHREEIRERQNERRRRERLVHKQEHSEEVQIFPTPLKK